ncbi:hypothetical protein V5799_019273 [Amblyomma americanum]|uniref:Caspase family p20 domain-containing protein n=1 Tax=Amblyomma americanum TaxID=6943 RepID=A0AAQ4EY60_AMBAM
MRRLFLALHFDCIVATNLKADEMKALLKWAAKECDKEKDDCLVLVLMCHGKENYIYGTDYEPLHLYNDVYEQFSKDNCPELKGKPKLFFVQASRRGQHSVCFSKRHQQFRLSRFDHPYVCALSQALYICSRALVVKSGKWYYCRSVP